MTALELLPPDRDASDTAAPITSCSAHYFELSGSTLAAAWYGQGLRVIDASNARNLRQVGYYYVTGTDARRTRARCRGTPRGAATSSTCSTRSGGSRCCGSGGGPKASAKMATVREPARGADPLAAVPVVRAHARLAGLPAARGARRELMPTERGVASRPPPPLGSTS